MASQKNLENLRSQLIKIVLLFDKAVGEDEKNNFGGAKDLYKKARTKIELVSCRVLKLQHLLNVFE
jgi:hypothetical protein